MIRASRHTIRFANCGKRQLLISFLKDYRCAVEHFVDYLWNNRVEWGNSILDISNNQLNCPSMMDYKLTKIDSPLSSRALSAAATQACGMVKAALEMQRRRLWKLGQLRAENKDTTSLERAIERNKLVKPTIPRDIKAELASTCIDLKPGSSFDHFLRVKSIGKQYGHIKLPIQDTKPSRKWSDLGTRMKSFLISKSEVQIRYQVEVARKTEGETLGLDQGLTTLFSFSNEVTSGKCPHGHDLSSITKRLCGQKKGSKSHRRTQSHRDNYIGYSLNKLKWETIKQINVEDISDLGRYRKKGRFLSHFTPGIILDKLERKSEEHGVRVNLIDCTYHSQRCSSCGWVQKSNRKGKSFSCKKCRHQDDADLNAAKNNGISLPPIPRDFRLRRNNLKGFYFHEGQEFIVPDTKESDI